MIKITTSSIFTEKLKGTSALYPYGETSLIYKTDTVDLTP